MNARSGAAGLQRRIDDEALQLEQRTDLEHAGHRDELPRPAYSAVVQLHLALDAGVRRERRPGELNTTFDRLVAFEIAMGVCESDLAVQAGGDGEPELRKITAIYAKVAVQVDTSSGGSAALDLGGGVEISEPVAAFDVDDLGGGRSVSGQYQRHDHDEQSSHIHLREKQRSKWCRSASRHHERAEVAVAMEHAHRAARGGAPRLGGREVEHPARIDDHAVILPGRVDGHEAAHDVAAHALDRTIEGVAPAAAAARGQPEHVAPAQDVAVGHRGQPPLVGAARVDDAAARPARVTTVHTGGWKQDVVLTDGHDRLVGGQLDLADHAGAAAEAPRPAGVLV